MLAAIRSASTFGESEVPAIAADRQKASMSATMAHSDSFACSRISHRPPIYVSDTNTMDTAAESQPLDFHDGELAQYAPYIDALRSYLVSQSVGHTLALHGPAHWARVEWHAKAICRHLNISPLVPTLFSLVHDSQRLTDGTDIWHGLRAARFVKESRRHWFAYLTAEQWEFLYEACAKHSEGRVSNLPVIAACWDADRLDLWRVGRMPEPSMLSTDFAQRPDVILNAAHLERQTSLGQKSTAL